MRQSLPSLGIEVVISDMILEEDWNQYIHEDRVFEINYCFSGSADVITRETISQLQYNPAMYIL
ncbi:MAG TPA: hypothetical protein VGI33_09870 [Paenibacillus sp.]|jgi:hypothetical protein